MRHLEHLVTIFREVRRVLRSDGTLWLVLGDCYAHDGKWGGETSGKQAYLPDNDRKRVGRESRVTGLKSKDLVGIPWRVAFALQADGWWLRSDIIWAKRNVIPESVLDRPTRAHEYIFLLAKSEHYYYDALAIREPAQPQSVARYTYAFGGEKTEHLKETVKPTAVVGDRHHLGEMRNKRSVWTLASHGFHGAHFATFPPSLIHPCVLAGSPPGGLVLDPFVGAGTTLLVAKELGRRALGIELNRAYIDDIAIPRLAQDVLLL